MAVFNYKSVEDYPVISQTLARVSAEGGKEILDTFEQESEEEKVAESREGELQELNKQEEADYTAALGCLVTFLTEERVIEDYPYSAAAIFQELDKVADFCESDSCTLENFRKSSEREEAPYQVVGFTFETMQLFDAIARLYDKEGRYGDAANIFKLLTLLFPQSPLLWEAWGLCAIKAERYAEALKPFTFLQAVDEESPAPRYYLAMCYYHLQNFHDADSTWQEADDLCRAHPDGQLWHERLAQLKSQF